MKIPSSVSRRVFAGLLGAAFLAPFSVSSVLAHEAPCPLCGMAITQDTPTQDNEVGLKIGRKRIEYKCVYCALAEAKTEYQGDLTIFAPSEKKGEPVLLKREGDKWTALPATAHFVSKSKLKHKICQEQARAFSTFEAAQKYIAANQDSLGDAKPLTLAEMLEVAGIQGGTATEKASTPAHPPAGQGNHDGHAK
jgi:hypothetical protein